MTHPTREVELKARVDDMPAARGRLEAAGASLVFEGMLRDRIYDTPARFLSEQDVVLRLRTYEAECEITGHLDWKGPTSREAGFKVRSELTTAVSDPAALATMLQELGYRIVRAIDRSIAQYELGGSTDKVVVRLEQYPRMDTLVEVEGTPARIEEAIAVLGIPRDRFSADRLSDFVRAYEARTGLHAAMSDAEMHGA